MGQVIFPYFLCYLCKFTMFEIIFMQIMVLSKFYSICCYLIGGKFLRLIDLMHNMEIF